MKPSQSQFLCSVLPPIPKAKPVPKTKFVALKPTAAKPVSKCCPIEQVIKTTLKVAKSKAKAKTLLAPKTELKVSTESHHQRFNPGSKDFVVAKQLPQPRLLFQKVKASKVCNAAHIESMAPATPEKYGPGNCMADEQPATPPDSDGYWVSRTASEADCEDWY